MATSRIISLGNNEFEILTDHTRFSGIGTVSINGRKIRSGRLPLLPFMQSFKGQQSVSFDLIDIKQTAAHIVIALSVNFKPVVLRQTLDWNLDHTIDTGDWNGEPYLRSIIRVCHRRPHDDFSA